MSKIGWCIKKKEGLELIEPNSNLAEAYIKKAEKALESMRINVEKEWKITTAYYTFYHSLYSVLTKIGVKCGIHSCTIEFAKEFLQEYFNKEEFELLEDALNARINSQYYVDRNIPDETYNQMIENSPEFLVKCKNILTKLNENKINEVRNKFERGRNECK